MYMSLIEPLATQEYSFSSTVENISLKLFPESISHAIIIFNNLAKVPHTRAALYLHYTFNVAKDKKVATVHLHVFT